MFVQTDSLQKLIKPLQNDNPNAIDFIQMLFSSSVSNDFRDEQYISGILQVIIDHSMRPGPQQDRMIYILGLIIKGNSTSCSKLQNYTRRYRRIQIRNRKSQARIIKY
ncbi:hypothetical protein TVAG_244960 [Trichomonas vaginalis G3]|uniref:Uncharacterized protein n=1 Tax=Trichomonas vaginalis (strain ATCC PRA-98 / G3) TaxID=412133 RepID=A2EMR8_TRIV3|nr:hypothetical protein TVAGG3_0428370 [Trichomonas vaginalis G3]EAY06064.1 hypothetical protein TVAG_244960 [Trichomonas vaginalis G3]KAI5536578.1 hypothetical protein TVAGG3_0428370 [Trichomonas vaginalis G3]|eukprot:XP_001318287.1 hypothetical protein [Trichomonas vaginalis G3]